jgi:tryptophan synthase beta chain
MVAWFQSIIGTEAKEQMLNITGRLPDRVYACVGGGSNAMGIFQGFLEDRVDLVGVEAGGKGLDTSQHAARLSGSSGSPGVAQGYKTFFLQNNEGQMLKTHSIAAGLDYIGVSPILSHLHQCGRVRFEVETDDEVISAFKLVMQKEGLIPALESAHAFACAIREAPDLDQSSIILINQSGRGDKDIFTIADAMGDEKWSEFIRRKASKM